MFIFNHVLLVFGVIATLATAQPILSGKLQKRGVDQATYAQAYPDWNGYRGGANSLIDISPDAAPGENGVIISAARAQSLVEKVAAVPAGFLRVQVFYDELLNDRSTPNGDKISKILQQMLQAGSDHGVYVIVSLRSHANGGGGNILTGQQLEDAKSATKKLIGLLNTYPNFIFGTFNEGATGGYTYSNWANMMTGLVKAARDASFNGFIAIDDSHWGGGLMDGSDSGIAWYADDFADANGGNTNKLIASFHAYVSGDEQTGSREFKNELDAVSATGMLPAVLEYGNANYGSYVVGDQHFTWQKRQAGISGLHDNLQNLLDAGGVALPWYEMLSYDAPEYTNQAIRGYGFKSDQQEVTSNAAISAPASPYDW